MGDIGECLYEKLKEYCAGNSYPLHMPGHKRRLGTLPDPFSIDITEIDGFDDLHHPEGILKEAQERAAHVYGAADTWYLVNGSTAGVLTAISAAAARGRRCGNLSVPCEDCDHPGPDDPGDPPPVQKRKLLLDRASHKSAYHAVYLNDLEPVYLLRDESGRIRPADVETALRKDPAVCAVFVTSPTYEGVVSDVAAIAHAAHRRGIPLIVDEAHGAHFGFHPGFPKSSVQQGADLVTHSLHKTLPSLTQTALLHRQGELISRENVQRYLDIYQTSSPSYVLMAAMDECVRLLQERGKWLLEQLLQTLERFYTSTADLEVLKAAYIDDPSRILLYPGDALSGKELCDILRAEYRLEPEMTAPSYVVALTSIGDDEEGLARLSNALHEIDRELVLKQKFPHRQSALAAYIRAEDPAASVCSRLDHGLPADLPPQRMSLREAWDAPGEAIRIRDSIGRISRDYVCMYPPGTPLLAPGEEITPQAADNLQTLQTAGYQLRGLSGKNEIWCVTSAL